MAWRDQLRPASFRGVPFETESASAEFGRDGVLQEPVGDDGVYFDDLGRKTRIYRLSGFIIAQDADANDYSRRRDALIAAVEERGPGTLVHPTFGTLTAQLLSCSINETIDEGRAATFELEFAEVGGQRPFPAQAVDQPAIVGQKADQLQATSATEYEAKYSTTGPDYVGQAGEDAKSEQSTRIIDAVRASLSSAQDSAEALRLASTLTTAENFPGSLASIGDAIGDRATLQSIVASIEPTTLSATGTTNERQAQQNARIVDIVTRTVLFAAACDAAASETFTAFDDAVAARDELEALADADEARDDVLDELHAAIRQMRLAMWDDLTNRALQLPRVVTYTPPGVTSAMEIAQFLYGDGSRADEIIARNNIPHPGFVSPEPLQVLSE